MFSWLGTHNIVIGIIWQMAVIQSVRTISIMSVSQWTLSSAYKSEWIFAPKESSGTYSSYETIWVRKLKTTPLATPLIKVCACGSFLGSYGYRTYVYLIINDTLPLFVRKYYADAIFSHQKLIKSFYFLSLRS